MKPFTARQMLLGACVVAATIVGTRLSAAPAGPPDVSKEPPLEFTIDADGQKLEMHADEPTTATIGGKKVTLTLTAKDTRRLVTPELWFRYPSGSGFEYDPSGGTQQWTLDGNNTVIILDRHEQKLPNDDLVKEVADAVAAKFEGKTERDATSTTLGGQTYKGTRLKINVGGAMIQQEIFAIDAGNVTYSMILQDSLTDGKGSAEMDHVRQLLNETFGMVK